MAYILGYIYADGSLEDSPKIRGKYIRVTSIDKDRLEFIVKELGAEHPIRRLKKIQPSEKRRYFVRIGSKQLYESLHRFGLTPKKSLTVRMPIVPKKFLVHFVRGYFDGDGCVFVETALNPRKRKILKALRVIFTSGSKRFLIDLEKIMRKNFIVSKRKIIHAQRSCQIRYGTSDSVRLFTYMYRHVAVTEFMERKYTKFKSYFERRPERIDFEVKRVLQCMDGLVAK